MSLGRRVLKNSFFLTLTTLSDRFAELVLFFFMARALGPSFVGDYKTIIMFLTIFQNLANYGLMQLVMREVAVCEDRGEVAELLMNYGTAGVVIALGLLVVMDGTAAIIGYPPQVTWGIYVVSLALIPSAWRRVAEATISGMESMEYISLVSFLGAIFRLVITFALLWRGGGIQAVLWVLVLTQFAIVPAYLYLINRFLAPGTLRPDLTQVRFMAKEVLLFLVMGILLMGVGTQIDVLMIRRMTTARQAGLYTAAATLVQAAFLLRPALLNSVFPNMATMYHDSPLKLSELSNNLLRLFTVVLLPLPFLTLLVADSLMPWLLGEDFGASAAVLQVLIWTVWPTFCYAMLSRVLIAGQRERDNIRVAAAGTVLNVALNLLLIPRWGAVGAAASSLATIIMALIITAVLIHRQLFRLDMGKTFGKALLALLPVAVLALYAERTAWPPLIHWLLLPLLIGVYLGLLWWTRVLPRKIIAVAKQELGSRLGRKLSARDVRTSGKEVPEP